MDAAVRDELDLDRLQQILEAHYATVTLKGPVRDEYLESLELSRL